MNYAHKEKIKEEKIFFTNLAIELIDESVKCIKENNNEFPLIYKSHLEQLCSYLCIHSYSLEDIDIRIKSNYLCALTLLRNHLTSISSTTKNY